VPHNAGYGPSLSTSVRGHRAGSDRSVTSPSPRCRHPSEPLEHAGDALFAIGPLVIGATLYCSAVTIPGGSPVGRATRITGGA